MSEWLKEHAWKACRVGRLSQVRILSLPPGSKDSMFWHRVFTFLMVSTIILDNILRVIYGILR